MNLLTGAWMIFIAVLMWFPLPGSGTNPLGHTDLVIHFGLFLVLGQLLFQTTRPDKNRFRWIDWATLLLVVTVVAETGQFFLESRSVIRIDYVINAIGGLTGGALCLRTTWINRWIKGFSLGFTALFVGFTSTLWGEKLYRAFLSIVDLTVPDYILPGGIVIGILGVYVYFRRKTVDLNWLDGGAVLLVLLLVIYSLTNSRPLGLLVLFAGAGIFASINQGYLESLEILGWLLFLMFVGTLVVTTQYYLDNFGIIYVGANCLVVLKILLKRASSHSLDPPYSDTSKRISSGQEY